MEQSLSFIFTIFFLTLGPVKTIPAFFGLTREATAKFRQKAALDATLIATGLCLFIGFFGRNVLGKWGVSLDALRLAGGLILLINALIMFLNYLGMLFANRIMNIIGLPALRLIGWVFAIMQSALAIDIMLEAGKSLGIVKQIP
jgi:multiple antibiotic resistance protein